MEGGEELVCFVSSPFFGGSEGGMTVLCSIGCTHRVTFFNLQFLFENKIVNFQFRQSHAH